MAQRPSPPFDPRAVFGVLIACALLRGVLAFVPSMSAWGANALRFTDPILGSALWLALIFAVLIPRLELIDAGLQRFGNAMSADATRTWTWVIAIATVMALVWLLPDRVQFTGDFRMREGALAVATSSSSAAGVFPQAMPLDAFLHFDLPRALMAATGWGANTTARVLGMLGAMALAICALVFVRALDLRGAAAATGLVIVLAGGYLGLFTGYGKAFAELSVATAAVGAFGLYALRHRSAWALIATGCALALAVAVHRSGIVLLPAVLVLWALVWRDRARRPSRATFVAAVAIPAFACAAFVPKAIEIARLGGDAVHFLPDQSGVIRAAFDGKHLLDIVNLIALLSPLAWLIPLLMILLLLRQRIASRGGATTAIEPWFLGTLAVPLLLVVLCVHPKQGIPRDWDVFAPAGVALSMLAAWICARLAAESNSVRLSRALAASAVIPALVWLVHNADGARGLARVEALVTERPTRAEAERATTWDFLAMAYSSENRWEDSARACEEAAACGRSARRLVQWGIVETMRQDYAKAQKLYADAVSRNPDLMLGWLGLAATSSAVGDTTQIKHAAGQIRRLEPHHPKLVEIARYLERRRSQS